MNKKIPHILCFIVGYLLLSLFLLILAAVKISAEFLFNNIPMGIAFLIASYLVGCFIYLTAD